MIGKFGHEGGFREKVILQTNPSLIKPVWKSHLRKPKTNPSFGVGFTQYGPWEGGKGATTEIPRHARDDNVGTENSGNRDGRPTIGEELPLHVSLTGLVGGATMGAVGESLIAGD